ncbi:site-specific integrase [Celeribacter marinus]|uniref:site-specific integrase n=1 Tax=Celeribacter marinus TaxID=1397108 RepID=UPI00316E155B
MRTINVKYVTKDKRNGHYIYRRRVPKALSGMVGVSEFVKSLGKTEGELLANYTPYHQQIEHSIELARHGVTGLSPTEQKLRLTALLTQWGADPHSKGRDDNEETWRGEAAGKLVDPYQDPLTGNYKGVPEQDALIAKALLSGIPRGPLQPTITDAFKFYLEENPASTPEKRKKQEQRFQRSERNLISATGGDKFISEITREDARKWRDNRKTTGVSASTIIREKNDISTVINTAISELDAGGDNAFKGLKMPKADAQRRQDRTPLPLEVIAGVYQSLTTARHKLSLIWTLLDFTGARPSEIRQLIASEFHIDVDVPHLIIAEREGRTLKTSWSNRSVPLVGRALEAAKEALRGVDDPSAPVFPHYASEGGMDRLSASLNKRIRELSGNPKHTTYSLRHNMSDRLRDAETFEATQKAILGHVIEKGEGANYGTGVTLERKREALIKALVKPKTGQEHEAHLDPEI